MYQSLNNYKKILRVPGHNTVMDAVNRAIGLAGIAAGNKKACRAYRGRPHGQALKLLSTPACFYR
jgi:hypothetical protein